MITKKGLLDSIIILEDAVRDLNVKVRKIEERYTKKDIAYLKARLSEYVVEEPEPQTIYAGTEENVEFFQQIATAFGIDKDSYSINLVDGEYEITIN